MYTILIDGKVLYSPNLASENYSVLNPKLTMELNKSGSLEFILPPNNVMYDQIQKLKSIVQVFDGSEEIFRGRVLHEERDFYRRKQVYCEGELAFLLDSIQRTYDYAGTLGGLFEQYINNHNDQVEESKRFTVGEITVTDKNNYVHYSSTQYPDTWSELKEKLINTHGGYIRTRFQDGIRYIDYIEDYETISPQIIEFGVNMLDISEYIKADNVFTVLIPLGATQANNTRLTIASVNQGKDYIKDDSAVDLFGYVWKVNMWDDVTVPENLKTKGQSYLNKGIQMSVSLEMKAVDLHLINVNTQRIRLGDYVRVLSVPHHLDKFFQCTKIILDLVNPKNSQYNFGVAFSSMTDLQVEVDQGTVSLETAVVTAQHTANQAQQSANHAQQTADQANSEIKVVINKIPTNYVTESTFETFQSEVNEKLDAPCEIEYILGTQTEATSEWTGVSKDKTLEVGKIIAYKLPVASTSSASTLTLTMSDGSTTEAVPIRRMGSSTVTTHYAMNNVLFMAYDGEFWRISAYQDHTYSPQSLGFGYGVCTTAEATTEKVVTLSGYSLVKNGMIAVRFVHAVPAGATLNVNERGAKAIYYDSHTIIAGVINAGDTVLFVYDGSYYRFISKDKNS